MTLIQIALTVMAWRRGWRWWALLPLGIAILLAGIVGFTVGTATAGMEDQWRADSVVETTGTVLDWLVLIVLLPMITGRKLEVAQ